jgi:O-acetyl-ADP-ribose deacetylase (regulator of RNase III)
MINVIKGDILEVKSTYIVIPVNCVGAPGKGVALAWAEKYPELVNEYKDACREDRLRPGEVGIVTSKDGQKFMLVSTKSHFKDPAKIEWVDSILRRIEYILRLAPYDTVTLPPIAGGLGWIPKSKVIKLIHRHLDPIGSRVTLIDNE